MRWAHGIPGRVPGRPLQMGMPPTTWQRIRFNWEFDRASFITMTVASVGLIIGIPLVVYLNYL